MWKDEYKRLFFSYKTVIIILILISLGCFSFYYSWEFRADFLALKQNLPVDVDPVNLNILLNYYKGLKFNLNFFLTSDYIQFFLIILLLFSGIFLASELNKLVTSGQENFILCRTSYKKHIKNLLFAQSLYLCTIIFISALIIYALGYIIGGFGGTAVPMGMFNVNHQLGILLIIIQILAILVYVVLVNAICLLSNAFIKEKIIIQSLPFVLFYIVPTIIIVNICNVFSIDYFLIKYFLPSTLLYGIDTIIQAESYFVLIKFYLTPFLVYTIIVIIMYFINKMKFGKDAL